ncbi:dipeptide ABC transporter ATP-binding protein [Ottowia thiooxydans]|uniref:dipeptide ABC transporter ATP-binding protein n=1 Tax=Ottowia thiooxydans TaxID=219182 RepID=UPI00040EA0F8|nr:ABC transporter ATP-binding protein [Ottowia thiooxydans]
MSQLSAVYGTTLDDEGNRHGDIVLAVSDLAVTYRGQGRDILAATKVSFQLRRGETTALLGESGSGKSTIVGAVAGTLPASALTVGTVLFGDDNLLTLPEHRFQRLRGTALGYVPQNPGRSLDPLQHIGQQLDEVLVVHGLRATRADRWNRVLHLLERVGFRNAATVARQYPHELSGGMQQRVLIAIAMAWTPQILIADEPTSALDVTVQKGILDLIDQRRAEDHMGVLLVTHDIGVAAERSQHVVVLRHGRIVEAGPTQQVLGDPQHEYTRQLLRDVPGAGPSQRAPLNRATRAPAISLSGVSVQYLARGGATGPKAVNDVSFDVAQGSTLAIVGESGSGKTTTARVIARFLAPSAGEVVVRNASGAKLTGVPDHDYRRHVQFVYQNPYLSLNPQHRIQTVLTEPLRALGIGTPDSHAARVEELLDMVALPKDVLTRKSRELSGGQLQRLAIARALAAQPGILVLDEPVSALDVTVQAQILRLLETLQSSLGLTYLFISHDLAVVRRIADEVAVMREGEVVERGLTEQVFAQPTHPYTRELIAAAPGLRLSVGNAMAAPLFS